MKKFKRKKKTESMSAMMSMPKPVSIHIHAEGAHLKEAHKNLAEQLKPMGFAEKKKRKGHARKDVGEALSR